MSADRPAPADVEPEAPREFRPTGEYRYPAMPADDVVRSGWTRLKQVFVTQEDSAPMIAEDRLQRATDGGFAPAAARPACDPLRRELDATLAEWAASEPDPFVPRLQLIVLPPGDGDGDGGGLLAAWADRHGLERLASPPRDGKGSFAAPTHRPPDLRGQREEGGRRDDPLVIPRLERWFLRRHDGLGPIRALLEAIDRTDRRIVIGCNSWAWAFLKNAVDAHLVLPTGRTFQAFDADRLSSWFRELVSAPSAGGRGQDPVSFRLSDSGGTVLGADGRGDQPNGSARDYYRTLAARSLGVPWVAWDLWRRSLRSETQAAKQAEKEAAEIDPDADPADSAVASPDEPERRTLWVAALEEFTLPARREPDALLILHSLLIHGPLTEAELRGTAPMLRRGGTGLLSALAGAGFVSHLGKRIACAPAAYPAVRTGLSASGFPTDVL
ncbi:hypothetical protein [Alienimonas chondri]|uniref:Uncharacterized protein n=1 Tax=Alienimonas chondri TaxID=2681879 RepID=A0ABX1VGU5_9PLAN|nr:hypothetical protein [Alienimonas chondri]NNJ26492.1 hypothetical protein [Alienimonas chondri]